MKPTGINKPHYQQTRTEKTINRLIDNDKELTEQALLQVYVTAQVEERIAAFRAKGQEMTNKQRNAEAHDSARLARNMERMGDPRPHDLCDAHAIISGAHPRAMMLRAVLAARGRRVDDPSNGCWLPKNTAAIKEMPRRLKQAVPHSRIHRTQYYKWLSSFITLIAAKKTEDLDNLLVNTSFKLQSGSYPPEIMLKAHEEHEAF